SPIFDNMRAGLSDCRKALRGVPDLANSDLEGRANKRNGWHEFDAGAVKALHQAVSDWITRHKHDRDRRACLLLSQTSGISAGGHEHIPAPLDKFGSERRLAGRTRREPTGIR